MVDVTAAGSWLVSMNLVALAAAVDGWRRRRQLLGCFCCLLVVGCGG